MYLKHWWVFPNKTLIGNKITFAKPKVQSDLSEKIKGPKPLVILSKVD